MAAKNDSQQIFSNLSSKFTQLIHGRTEEHRNIINKTLDELNSLNYRYTIVTNSTQAVLLINQCCTFIPPEDVPLVSKCCQLITNLVIRQNVNVEGRTLTISIQWCFQALKNEINHTTLDVLSAVDGLLRTNTKNLHSLIVDLIHKNSPLVYLSEEKYSLEIIFHALQCLEACTIFDSNCPLVDASKYSVQFNLCLDIFQGYLSKESVKDDVLYSKILILCLRGIDNIILHNNTILKNDIGLFLGYVKTYMVYGIKDIEYLIPQRIMPSSMSIPEPSTNMSREKKGGKITKQRKHRTGNKKNPPKTKELIDDENTVNGYNCSQIFDFNSDSGINVSGRLKTSDSDFSDNEGGRAAKLAVNQSRVRQAALHLFFTILKLSDKSVMFSYWSSFIPQNNSSGKHNLMTSILKDPSPRGRMAALNALLLLLSSSKLYLTQAESRDQNASFTPFSVVLGFMVKELHKCLSLALTENYLPVLTQVLKCFAALVQATPYHRLSSGTIGKVIRNVKMYIQHKDSTVQVAALIVMGCLLASEPVVLETKEILMKHNSYDKSDKMENKSIQTEVPLEDFEYVDFSSDEEESLISTTKKKIPWIVEKCLNNLGVMFNDDETKIVENLISAPVKLESLQVLSAMSRNYFDSLMAPHIHYITKALDISLSDKNIDLKLHAGRAVDSIGQAMNKYFSSEETGRSATLEQGLYFWQTLLNGSLTSLLQNEQNFNLRAVGCDCIGSIGSPIFEHLPRDKQILCVTLLFGCSKDEENNVKGAAVRALAICVLYPSLREDVGFVVDTASAIHTALQEDNLTVRIKASWALGNLSDALVLNSLGEDLSEELPHDLLLKLFNSCIKCSGDHDKVKMNTVRALGNFLQLVSTKNNLCNVAENGISALVRNATTGSNMKVRWNACYAIGNALKNNDLYAISNNWEEMVFKTLTDLVISFRNFKVRINAALALSSPNKRVLFGQYYLHVWTALLKALENSQNIEDFNEYKHRDHLVDQICLTLGHLSRLLTKEDLIQLQDSVTFNLESLITYMNRVSERVVPEKSVILVDASSYVNILLKENGLSSEQISTLRNLTKIFNDLNVNPCS